MTPLTKATDADLRPNKRLTKQSRRRRFETPLSSLWRHRNCTYPVGHGLFQPVSIFLKCNFRYIPVLRRDSNWYDEFSVTWCEILYAMHDKLFSTSSCFCPIYGWVGVINRRTTDMYSQGNDMLFFVSSCKVRFHVTSKLRITDPFVKANHRWSAFFPHKGPIMLNGWSSHDVIMLYIKPDQKWEEHSGLIIAMKYRLNITWGNIQHSAIIVTGWRRCTYQLSYLFPFEAWNSNNNGQLTS